MDKNKMKTWYDEDVDLLYISLKKGVAVDSREIGENIRVEYNRKGEIIGLEIQNISKYIAKSIAERLKEVIAK